MNTDNLYKQLENEEHLKELLNEDGFQVLLLYECTILRMKETLQDMAEIYPRFVPLCKLLINRFYTRHTSIEQINSFSNEVNILLDVDYFNSKCRMNSYTVNVIINLFIDKIGK